MKKIQVIFIIIMLGLTILNNFESISTFVFAQGSNGLVKVACPNILILIFIILIFGIFFIFKIFSKDITNILLILIFIIWLISGRVIGHIPFPEEKVITGWFYIPTKTILLCEKNNLECENIAQYTTIEKLPFWRVRIKNDYLDRKLYVGPFIWNKTLLLFEENNFIVK